MSKERRNQTKGKELKGKVQTVLGVVDSDDMGITLPHEHLLIDTTVWFKEAEPTEASERLLAYQPVSLENLWWVRYHVVRNLDNVQLLDEQLAISEALRYRNAGGNSIVDMTSIGLSRDPLARVIIFPQLALFLPNLMM